MAPETDLTSRLREWIVRELHLGHVRSGDRLPSIRQISRELRADNRRVARAYRGLESEGLVEVRGRSGVYVAEQEQNSGELLAETQRWMAGVLTEAWTRQINAPDYPDLVRRCTASVRVCCACVESVEDVLSAYCSELKEGWGFETFPVRIGSAGTDPDRTALEALRGADLVTTTSFHAGAVRAAAEALGKPVVVLMAHPDLEEAIRRRLREGRLTIIAVDVGFAGRIRALYGDEVGAEGALRVVAADDAAALAELDPSEPVLLTRAARQKVGDLENPAAIPRIPVITPPCARELFEILIRFNMEARPRQGSGGG